MKLRSITVEYFRGFREKTEVEIHDGINAVLGENSSGKSSLLNAIEWCLFGREAVQVLVSEAVGRCRGATVNKPTLWWS